MDIPERFIPTSGKKCSEYHFIPAASIKDSEYTMSQLSIHLIPPLLEACFWGPMIVGISPSRSGIQSIISSNLLQGKPSSSWVGVELARLLAVFSAFGMNSRTTGILSQSHLAALCCPKLYIHLQHVRTGIKPIAVIAVKVLMPTVKWCQVLLTKLKKKQKFFIKYLSQRIISSVAVPNNIFTTWQQSMNILSNIRSMKICSLPITCYNSMIRLFHFS